MNALTNRIREIARNLLEEGRVDVVIGFERGTTPLRSTPCFARTPGDTDRLVWNGFCGNNLANYVVKRKERTAVVAKGCDSRALVELIKENQIPRERLHIIGVPCNGMLDRTRIETEFHHRIVLEVEEQDGSVMVKGKDVEKVLRREDFLYPSCRACVQRNPILCDDLAGEAVEEAGEDSYRDIEEFEGLPDEERWAYFSREMDRCIRCYACRNACPLCYCEECFVDCSMPQWIGKSVDPSDTALFHLMRAFHLAGRCVECGACERACPLGIDIRKLNRKLAKDVLDLYGYRAGTNPGAAAPLSTYRPDDPEAFVLEP
ncbi:MAG: Coenzyme F420 hydrogenase/dehydrogenase, beta subunit C-terminal domain [Deltaproteobacteria bacterium]|nr:Coenzyme F420 hydrogenase/dehydrogenase, beta subunit C-terminal domain [Deltaproteobacteria bacterium]